MYIYGGNIVQIGSVLILDLTGSVGITAVILIGITVNYDLGCGSYYRSSLNRIGLNRACLLCAPAVIVTAINAINNTDFFITVCFIGFFPMQK